MPQNEITYIGRNDGLGNRLEEIIVLCAYAKRTETTIRYLFNNLNGRNDRRYPLLFSVASPFLTLHTATRSNVFLARAKDKIGYQKCFGIKELPTFRQATDSESLRESARGIAPLFDLPAKTNENLSAIHIRGTDRIDPKGGPHFLKSREQLEINLKKAVAYRKTKKGGETRVFSEEPALAKRVAESLSHIATVSKRDRNSVIPTEYLDLFSLAQSDEIIMAGAPSSFCLVAAMIGNTPVSYVYLPPDLMDRFPTSYSAIGSIRVTGQLEH
ncbi:hypothetical protein [Ruegeria arenilitoris]|uniref:hypothetical protein n=1 Tax=Ruegeria arenilitoris TaxID=1173585 RepID=UPI001481A6F1|nr:hypothetical protein [Ruegeria arenilitoris]